MTITLELDVPEASDSDSNGSKLSLCTMSSDDTPPPVIIESFVYEPISHLNFVPGELVGDPASPTYNTMLKEKRNLDILVDRKQSRTGRPKSLSDSATNRLDNHLSHRRRSQSVATMERLMKSFHKPKSMEVLSSGFGKLGKRLSRSPSPVRPESSKYAKISQVPHPASLSEPIAILLPGSVSPESKKIRGRRATSAYGERNKVYTADSMRRRLFSNPERIQATPDTLSSASSPVDPSLSRRRSISQLSQYETSLYTHFINKRPQSLSDLTMRDLHAQNIHPIKVRGTSSLSLSSDDNIHDLGYFTREPSQDLEELLSEAEESSNNSNVVVDDLVISSDDIAKPDNFDEVSMDHKKLEEMQSSSSESPSTCGSKTSVDELYNRFRNEICSKNTAEQCACRNRTYRADRVKMSDTFSHLCKTFYLGDYPRPHVQVRRADTTTSRCGRAPSFSRERSRTDSDIFYVPPNDESSENDNSFTLRQMPDDPQSKYLSEMSKLHISSSFPSIERKRLENTGYLSESDSAMLPSGGAYFGRKNFLSPSQLFFHPRKVSNIASDLNAHLEESSSDIETYTSTHRAENDLKEGSSLSENQTCHSRFHKTSLTRTRSATCPDIDATTNSFANVSISSRVNRKCICVESNV